MANITIVVPNAAVPELVAAAAAAYPRLNGETDTQYATRIVRKYFFLPLVNDYRIQQAVATARANTILATEVDLGG